MNKYEVAIEILKTSALSGGLKNKTPNAVSKIYAEILENLSPEMYLVKKASSVSGRGPGRPTNEERGVKGVAQIRAEQAAAEEAAAREKEAEKKIRAEARAKARAEKEAEAKKTVAKSTTSKKTKTAATAAKTTAKSRKRGRPAGSKNKPKPVEAAAA